MQMYRNVVSHQAACFFIQIGEVIFPGQPGQGRNKCIATGQLIDRNL